MQQNPLTVSQPPIPASQLIQRTNLTKEIPDIPSRIATIYTARYCTASIASHPELTGKIPRGHTVGEVRKPPENPT